MKNQIEPKNLLAYEYANNNNFFKALKIVISKLEGTWGLAILNIGNTCNTHHIEICTLGRCAHHEV